MKEQGPKGEEWSERAEEGRAKNVWLANLLNGQKTPRERALAFGHGFGPSDEEVEAREQAALFLSGQTDADGNPLGTATRDSLDPYRFGDAGCIWKSRIEVVPGPAGVDRTIAYPDNDYIEPFLGSALARVQRATARGGRAFLIRGDVFPDCRDLSLEIAALMLCPTIGFDFEGQLPTQDQYDRMKEAVAYPTALLLLEPSPDFLASIHGALNEYVGQPDRRFFQSRTSGIPTWEDRVKVNPECVFVVSTDESHGRYRDGTYDRLEHIEDLPPRGR